MTAVIVTELKQDLQY